ncbi:hypothetical protein [Paenibacillus sp. FSL R5-0490]|uniref:hypothetical protein n=1 Tax=Bacillales TaxID=1385 RepID=UPI00158A622A|nr:hypothetical protein [Paenibacillus sp. FSL R5-0490]
MAGSFLVTGITRILSNNHYFDNSAIILYDISINEVLYRGRRHEEAAVNRF